MINNSRHFTILELLLSIAIIAILSAILLPSLTESKKHARFARWIQFNKQCSTDPTCVVNLNFQEKEGESLTNSAQAYDADNFNVKNYTGHVKGDYVWGNGRWIKGKGALQLDGASTYVEFPKSEHLDFTGKKDFTFMLSIKFDTLNKWDGIFGKCYTGTANDDYAKYALYYDGDNDDDSKKLFQMDIGPTSIMYYAEDKDGNAIKAIETSAWTHLAMRNKVIDKKQVIDLFINGVKLKSVYKNHATVDQTSTTGNVTIGCINWQKKKSNNSSNIFHGYDSYTVYSDYGIYCKSDKPSTVDQNGGEGNGNNGQSDVNNDQNGDGPGNNGKGGGNSKDKDSTENNNQEQEQEQEQEQNQEQNQNGSSSTVDQNGGEGNGNNGQSDVNNDQNGSGPGNNGQGNAGNNNSNDGNNNNNDANNNNSNDGNNNNSNDGNNNNSNNGNNNSNDDSNNDGNNNNNNNSSSRQDNFLKGKIDELVVYNRALTDNEIKAHFEMGDEHL